MAENKKSFVVYSDWRDTFKELTDEDAGKLIKHIFSYVNDENPETDNSLIRAVFAQIKSTLKRDLEKWDTQLQQRKEAGLRSAESRKNNTTNSNERSTTVETRTRNSTVNDNVSVSVSDNVNKKKVVRFTPPTLFEVLAYFEENGYSKQSAERAYKYYDTAAWTDSKGSKVKNWKQKMQGVWFKPENEKTIGSKSQYSLSNPSPA